MKVAMIGCGNMGTAYIISLLRTKVVTEDDLILVDKDELRTNYLNSEKFGKVYNEVPNLSEMEVVVIAVKPQFFEGAAQELTSKLNENQIVISIMAGITMDRIQSELNHQKVVRAMPNTPCQIGMGVTAYSISKNVSADEVVKVESVLKSTGRTVFLEDENHMDIATALSGSGPAYFFRFVNQMVKAGTEMGLSQTVAELLVKQTMFGSYHLMNHKDEPLENLIERVTSRGGTTEAALNFFSENNFDETVKGAMKKARDRGKELAKNN